MAYTLKNEHLVLTILIAGLIIWWFMTNRREKRRTKGYLEDASQDVDYETHPMLLYHCRMQYFRPALTVTDA